MFLTPLASWFFFLPRISGLSKKISYAALYLFFIWGLNLSIIYLVNLSGWESKTDRALEKIASQESVKEKNEYARIHAQVGSIGTLSEAMDYLHQYLIAKRKTGNGNDDAGLEDEKAEILWLLNQKQKEFGDEATAKIALLLLQYAGGTTEETTEEYDTILWENTSAALQAMVEAKNEFFPELRNQKFYEYLYEMVLCVPYDNTSLSEEERVLKAKPYKDILLRLRNAENADFVDYLVEDHRMENWTN